MIQGAGGTNSGILILAQYLIRLPPPSRIYLQEKRTGDVWNVPRVAGKQQVHQNQKPVELIQKCIEYHSKPGDVVFDGFMGSGTTAVAATRCGRRFLGYEIEPKYFGIITDRLKEGADGQIQT